MHDASSMCMSERRNHLRDDGERGFGGDRTGLAKPLTQRGTPKEFHRQEGYLLATTLVHAKVVHATHVLVCYTTRHPHLGLQACQRVFVVGDGGDDRLQGDLFVERSVV